MNETTEVKKSNQGTHDYHSDRTLFLCKLDNSIVNIWGNTLIDFPLLTAQTSKTKLQCMCHSTTLDKEVQ